MLLRVLFQFSILISLQSHAWDLHTLGGVDSDYTKALIDYLKAPSEIITEMNDENRVGIRCFSYPKNEYYIGAAQFYKVATTVDKLEKLLLQFADYPKWFDGLVSASATLESEHRSLVSFEQYVPVPFVSNIKYKMIYEVEASGDQHLIRYQFSSGKTMKTYDGFVLLKKDGESHTQVVEYDFIDADWGPAKVMGKSSIWTESITGMVQTDLALKLRAENSDLSDKEVMKQSKASAKKTDIQSCLDHKTKFQYLAN